jgi:NADH:ubiquinone oxidoreductase subunit 6 (subunit J)
LRRCAQEAQDGERAANLSHVFWALAMILIAFAGFTVVVVRLRQPVRPTSDSTESADSTNPARRIDLEQLRGFVYVGAVALALLAVAVILMGLFANRNGRAEGLAVLGFFGYAGYLVAATVVLYVTSRRS